MSNARMREIVRHFPENGMKLMLENPLNARDLLLLSRARVVELIDCDHLSRVKTTFVKRDYRHVESDVVLLAPLRHKKEQRSRRAIPITSELEQAREGVAILFYSTDVTELTTLCRRVIVLHDGRVRAELSGDNVTEETIVGAAIGGGLGD